MVSALVLNIRANPCTNRCRHCWAEGSPDHTAKPTAEVKSTLEELAAALPLLEAADFFLLDEPTNRPDFVEIFEYAAGLGLLGPNSFVATNGSGLARAGADTWRRLQATGLRYLQFTFYGVGETHDRFAGRRGAFDDVVAAVRGADEAGFPWYGAVILRPGDAGDVRGTVEYVEKLGAPEKVGYFGYAAQGRGAKGRRPTTEGEAEKASLESGTTFASERRLREAILADGELSQRRVEELFCPPLVLEVDAGGEVSCGGACDSGGLAGAVPELKTLFSLGRLGDKTLAAMIEDYRQDLPAPLRAVAGVTWGQLAAQYGDPANEDLFWAADVVISKWARDYLRERYGPR
ncbi:MAG: radical SAM protein [Candidatus Coatesbacteria bacterium]|nr:MAG: radical SAM protein [Candidatus Coatesbacteria bacterium]